MSGLVHWAKDVGEDWAAVLAELTRAFEESRSSAQTGESIVYVVRQDDL